ncbi:PREDICTED: probable G-protein coupled receptor 128 [Elephantulus edwardii]|uniref:probable G-protein coupled receptor 128 n=1 Tax=Elephantulus edwardii TaxID=28737 RepID=UPI0003F0938F|nr:PREDICTED: probable G-protein coupled receptor 128 [Elephantulus edwardii]
MVSCQVCNLRELVAIVCGLLTTIILGLGIWRCVIRIQRGSYAPPSSTPVELCRNGGTWENGRCVCTDEWRGLRCTIVNFCEEDQVNNFTFQRIPVGRYGPSKETCEENTANAGTPKASCLCTLNENEEPVLQSLQKVNCSQDWKALEEQIQRSPEESLNISRDAQLLTTNASMLTVENITSATTVVEYIFRTNTSEESAQAKKNAVTTVSQLLEASEEVFQQANVTKFTELIEQIENYSLTLEDSKVVQPNIAVQSVKVSENSQDTPSSVLFSVLKGSGNYLTNDSTTDKNIQMPNPQAELQILLSTSESITKCGFVVYQNNKFFQSKTFKSNVDFSQRIISSKPDTKNKAENKIDNISVEMVFSPKYNQMDLQLHSYACVFWDLEKSDWDTAGCKKTPSSPDFLGCHCNHTTNFAILMSFKKNYIYPQPLDVLSQVGCALSITGLVLTIIFQLATRKVRKTSVTWVLVSLCTSMLIFNLLFVFGIENSNNTLSDKTTTNTDPNDNAIPTQGIISTSNPTCTAVAALLHYFLLATFTWSGLSSAQLYFLLIWTMKPLPRHFILFISLIGWGVPAMVVGMTVGIVYSQNSHSNWELSYRQEEICWLGFQEGPNFIKSTMLWSFYIPVTIILISNVVIFIVITVKVLWKNNENLTSTKKFSSIKKILSTLSIAVVFGITWILAYFMLVNKEGINIVFSYIFCLFNTTQGLQIFIFYTVRTKIFQSEASKVLKSLSTSVGRMKPSMSPLRLRLRMYNLIRSLPTLNERFRLLDPAMPSEEMFMGSETGNTNM